MNQNKKKVVIVDDHPLFRERLAQLINYEPDMEVTGEAENTKDAIQLIRNTSPDLATVDITFERVQWTGAYQERRAVFCTTN